MFDNSYQRKNSKFHVCGISCLFCGILYLWNLVPTRNRAAIRHRIELSIPDFVPMNPFTPSKMPFLILILSSSTCHACFHCGSFTVTVPRIRLCFSWEFWILSTCSFLACSMDGFRWLALCIAALRYFCTLKDALFVV